MKSEICSIPKMEIDEKCSIVGKDRIFESLELPKLINISVVPVAPTPERNNEEQSPLLNCDDSPLTWGTDSTPASAAADDGESDVDLDSSPRTPKENVFNSFAPGPDHLMLAPQVKKVVKESKVSVFRRLDFDSAADVREDDKLQEEEVVLLDKIYESLLDVILLKQTEDEDEDEDSGLKTPTKIPFLTGIAETCPGAPTKARSYSKRIDLELCRRLEF